MVKSFRRFKKALGGYVVEGFILVVGGSIAPSRNPFPKGFRGLLVRFAGPGVPV